MDRRRRISCTLAVAAMALTAAASVATAPSTASTASTTPTADPVGVVVAHNRSEAKIRSVLAGWPHHGLDPAYGVTFATPPAYSAPYAAGKVAADRQMDALRALKAVRFLAGVPTDISFTSVDSNLAQHCTVLLAATNQFAHT